MYFFYYFFVRSLKASSRDMLDLLIFLLKLLKLNLPEFLRNLNKPQILISCNNEIPAFVLIKGKIANKNGREKMYLPA